MIPTSSFQIARAKRIRLTLRIKFRRNQLAENGGDCDPAHLHCRSSDCTASVMIQRLLILLRFCLRRPPPHARGIEPELAAEGPAPPGGEVELAINMRPQPGWHGYWLNPGDAGLPMAGGVDASARAFRSALCAIPFRPD